MKRLTALALTLVLTTPCIAQETSVKDHPRVREAVNLLEVWVDAQRAYEEIPGISMAVVHDQELVWSKGFGYAHPDRQIEATPQTVYSICSISKLFTSIGVMQQRDEGRLRLDDPAGEHLDWFNIEDTYPDACWSDPYGSWAIQEPSSSQCSRSAARIPVPSSAST